MKTLKIILISSLVLIASIGSFAQTGAPTNSGTIQVVLERGTNNFSLPQLGATAVINTDAMIYPAIKEMTAAGLIACREEVIGGRKRKVCELTDQGWQAYRTAARAWANALPGITNAVAGALDEPTQGDHDEQERSGDDPACCD